MKLLLFISTFCFSISAFSQTVGQWELRKRTSTGFTSYGLTHENGKAIGFTGDVPVMLPLGGSATLAGLSDVSLSGVANLNVLQYNSTSGKWENEVLAMPFSSLTGVPTTLAGHGITDSITAALAASTYAPLASPVFTGVPALPLGTTFAGNGGTIFGMALMAEVSADTLRSTLSLASDGAVTFGSIGAGSITLTGDFDTPGNVVAGQLQGSGLFITALNASELTSGTLPAARMPALTGDVTTTAGAVATTIATGAVGPTQIASTGVTPGSYTATNLTVDADGRITAASSGSSGVTSITGTANQITVTGTTTPTLSLPATITGLTSVTSTTFVGALTGTASGNAALGANTFTGAQYISNTTASTTNVTGALRIAGGLGVAGAFHGGGDMVLDSTWGVEAATGDVLMYGAASLSWGTNLGGLGNPKALSLWKDATDILAQRRGTNAQVSRIYNTYTSSTSYERAAIEWASNVLRIGTQKGSGGGTARDMILISDDTERARINATGLTIASGLDLKLGNTAVAETPTATHTIIIKDAAGVSYRVLAIPVP